ncbi:hypothetical protein C8R46DRAFT_1076004 [Mycena filopes]|nr:hypothetical protein C8R46DRAFT_1076004 [Mycena filopes]
MSRRPGGGAQPPNTNSGRYMEVPHGDPFSGSIQANSIRGEYSQLGRGPPPSQPVYRRAVTLNTPMPANRHLGRSTPLDFSSHPDEGFLNTPTQTNRRAMNPTQSMHYGAPLPPSQLDTLVDMMQRLTNETVELKHTVHELREDTRALGERLTVLEGAQPASSRGVAARRGRSTRSKLRARHARGASGQDAGDSEIDPALLADNTTDTDTGVTDSESADLGDVDGDLSSIEQTAVQKYVTKTFRRCCHVPSGTDWPDPNVARTNPITHEVYYTPFFEFDVTDPRNTNIFRIVAEVVMEEFKYRDAWPEVVRQQRVNGPSPSWDFDLFTTMAKESFRSMKKQYKRQHDANAAQRGELNDQKHRQNQRRIHKSQNLLKVANTFAAKHNLDTEFVEDLVHPEYLSDEVSGPEDEAVEAKAAWKVRMAAGADVPLTPETLEKSEFLEVLLPAWRTDPYASIVHDLAQFWYDSLTPTQKKKITYVRVVANRVATRIPVYAPYNFGLRPDWLQKNRREHDKRDLLHDWGKYPEPENSGVAAYLAEKIVEAS